MCRIGAETNGSMINEQASPKGLNADEVDADETSVDDLMETPGAGAGDRLRSAREARRMELSHIAAETRIPVRHLESIEASAFDALPSRTYAIGFARTYARIVGLDEKSIADAVREELAEGGIYQTAAAGGMEPGDSAKLPSRALAWFSAIAALILIAGIVVFSSRFFGAGVELPSLLAGEDAAAETDGALVADAGAESSEGAGAGDPAASSTATIDGQVVFTATGEGAWVRFYEEGGERLFEGVMEEGDTYEVPLDAEDPRINTGRPNLFNVTIGGAPVAPIATEMVPVADTPVSAAALLARGEEEAGGEEPPQ